MKRFRTRYIIEYEPPLEGRTKEGRWCVYLKCKPLGGLKLLNEVYHSSDYNEAFDKYMELVKEEKRLWKERNGD